MKLDSTKGVYTRLSKDGTLSFRASFTFKRKHISLGSFFSQSDAVSAYQEALKLSSDFSLSIDDYSDLKPCLPFEKWVSILNFRDNGIYIRTPIYLKERYFLYYLSPTDIMKFDVEDLFYYSNHKILKRGGHLFLSDYGMQVNLLTRYGIKNFAVKGKDYTFLNGDFLDFRYSNLNIINKYYGVSLEKELPKPVYLAKINIKGSNIIGRYEEETIAAIAYNKVVDLLKRNGFQKNFEKNYVEGLDRPSYDEIYKQIGIHKRLLKVIASLKDSEKSLL